MNRRSIFVGMAAFVSAPLYVYAATSANYNLTQEGTQQNQYIATTTGYTFQAEIGAPTESPAVSSNYEYNHGASWFSSSPGSAPTPVIPPSTASPQSGALTAASVQSFNQSGFQIIQINEHAILVSWMTNQPGQGRVVYGPKSVDSFVSSPTYGYAFTTPELTDASTYQALVIDNLEAGKLYYFRPVSSLNGGELIGPQFAMAPLSKTSTPTDVRKPTTEIGEPTKPATPTTASPPSTPTTKPSTSQAGTVNNNKGRPLVTSMRKSASGRYVLTGTAKPGSTVRIIVY